MKYVLLVSLSCLLKQLTYIRWTAEPYYYTTGKITSNLGPLSQNKPIYFTSFSLLCSAWYTAVCYAQHDILQSVMLTMIYCSLLCSEWYTAVCYAQNDILQSVMLSMIYCSLLCSVNAAFVKVTFVNEKCFMEFK